MAKRVWAFLGFAFAFSWIVWIVALSLGAGPSSGEHLLAFGSAGPAAAAILLSRDKGLVAGSRWLRLAIFVLVWLLALCVYLTNDSLRGVRPSMPSYRLVVGMLAVIPAWVISGALSRDSGVRQLLGTLLRPRSAVWPCFGFFFFPVILLFPGAIVRLFGGGLALPPHRDSLWAYVFQGAIAFLNALLFTAVLEEPGWRGFLLPQLQKKFSPLLAGLLVWLPWAVWHAPLDFSGGIGRSWMTYVQVRVAFLIPIAIILTWLYNRSGADLLSVALFHTGMNTFPFILPYAPKMLALIFVFAIYVVFAQRMWRRERSTLTNPIAARSEATART